MNSGEVVWIEFPGVVQTKRRPAVILSSATYHSTRPDLIVGLAARGLEEPRIHEFTDDEEAHDGDAIDDA